MITKMTPVEGEGVTPLRGAISINNRAKRDRVSMSLTEEERVLGTGTLHRRTGRQDSSVCVVETRPVAERHTMGQQGESMGHAEGTPRHNVTTALTHW